VSAIVRASPTRAGPGAPRGLGGRAALAAAGAAATRLASAAALRARSGFGRLAPTLQAARLRFSARPSGLGMRAWLAGATSRVGAILPQLRPTGRRGWLGVAAAVLALALLPVVAFIAYAMATIPRDGGMAAEPTLPAVFLAAGDGQVFATRGVVKGEKLSPAEFSEHLKNAVVAIEDRRFRSHPGLDLWGMGRAVFRNLGGGRGGREHHHAAARAADLPVPGALLAPQGAGSALALWLDWTLSKDEILART
jgi:hypothetical protein